MGEIYDTTGLTIKVSRPVVQDGSWVANLRDNVNTYNHEISAEGGFDRATVSFSVNRNDVSEWLNRGLGMDIDVRSRAGDQVWNGLVDIVDINEGSRKTSVGKLSDIANMVAVSYAVIIEGGDEPIVGEQVTGEYESNTESQDIYGTWEKVVNAGSKTDGEAEQIRGAVLAKYAYPTTSYDITASDDVSVTLKCVGYKKFLDAFTYNTDDNDEVTTDAKVKLVLAAEASVNGVLSTDYSRIQLSSAYIGTFEDKNRKGLTVINECASYGDASDNAWTFGVYENRQPVFEVVPTTISYVHRRGIGPVVERLSGGVVDPWQVRPAQWLFMPDIILGGAELPIPNTRAQMYADKRVAFIERVQYTAPRGFVVQGTRLLRGSQQLARWGLGSL